MKAIIVYDSQFGNTERIAQVIAERLGAARLLRVEDAGTLERKECDLLIVASPTQRHGASPAIQAWLERLPRRALKDVPAAAFDTGVGFDHER
jgi:flavodoxin